MNTSSVINKTCVLAAILLVSLSAQAGWKEGSSLPDLTKFKLEGKLPADLKGKVILLDFWASWCAPCKASFPILDNLAQNYGSQGLIIIAINQDQTLAQMTSFLGDNPVSFLILRDAENKLVEAADVQSMPSSFLIDRSGKIRFTHTGFHGDKTTTEYKMEIEKLLNEKIGVKK